MLYYFSPESSSLISEIYYDEESCVLTVHFLKGYYLPYQTHVGVSLKCFLNFGEVKSVGSYYLNFINKKFKIMADKKRPKTINECSGKVRYLECSMDVTKIRKDWLIQGEKGGVYLNFKFRMLPNGEVDRFGNLAMLTQKVPADIVKAEKDLDKDQKTSGPILGNACEFEPFKPEGTPGDDSGEKVTEEAMDDLPF